MFSKFWQKQPWKIAGIVVDDAWVSQTPLDLCLPKSSGTVFGYLSKRITKTHKFMILNYLLV